MSYTLKKLPDEPIFVFKAGADYDTQSETEPMNRKVIALLDAAQEPLVQIIDFSEASLDMNDMMAGASAAARGEDAPLHHPNVKLNLFVTRDPAFKMAVDGLNNEVFGRVFAKVFENYEEALAYARSQS